MIAGIEALVAEVPLLLRSRAYYSALSSALIIPDVCAALEAPDGRATGDRYAAWFDRYVGPQYGEAFTGQDCYQYRCGVVHQLRGAGHRSRYSRVIFVVPQPNVFHRNILNDAYNIDIHIFCNDIISGYRIWREEKFNDPLVQRHVLEMMNVHPDGLAPYIIGAPVIG